MKKACIPFSSGQLPDHLREVVTAAAPDDLKLVAKTFIDLQQSRHEADYNVSRAFNRQDALTLVQQTRAAFEAWQRVRKQQIATVFLVSLLLGAKWKRGA